MTDATDPTIPGTGDEISPDGPPALNKDGSVRRKPGPKPGQKRAPKEAAAPGRRPTVPQSRQKSGDVDYRPSLVGLASLPQMALGIVARLTKRPTLALDGIAIGIHAPNIAAALNETAKTESRLAAALDRMLAVGPYGLVAVAVIPLMTQVMVNHGISEPNPDAGTLAPDELADVGARMAAA